MGVDAVCASACLKLGIVCDCGASARALHNLLAFAHVCTKKSTPINELRHRCYSSRQKMYDYTPGYFT